MQELTKINLIDFMEQDAILMPYKNMAQLLTKLEDDNFFHKNYQDNDRLDRSQFPSKSCYGIYLV